MITDISIKDSLVNFYSDNGTMICLNVHTLVIDDCIDEGDVIILKVSNGGLPFSFTIPSRLIKMVNRIYAIKLDRLRVSPNYKAELISTTGWVPR